MKSHGYTLIEILIVIVIISIVASVATLSIHFNQKKQLENVANNLVNLITLAEEEAMLRPAVLGLAVMKNKIQFFIYDENKKIWQPLPENILKNKTIADNIQINFTLDNQMMPADGKPHLFISSNGEIPAFTILIGIKNQSPLYTVVGEETGNIYAK